MANAPAAADIGRVYLHENLRVVLVNDRLAADPTAGEQDYQVAVKPIDPAPGPGGDTYPVALVDYRYLVATDERVYPNAPDYVNQPGFPVADEADHAADSGDETIPEAHR